MRNPLGPGSPAADVAGQLRWYILRDLNEYHHKRHRLDFEDAKKHRVRERIDLVRRKLERVDPLYRLTTDIMEHFEREHLPKSLQGSL
ncbi:hypothetical protein, partial [Fundidesulfovibrio magnetotacticus]|uniref:hypothetical protein n=1 Tax=Fundidesulfovibrio magnetotacticus TaxID=2730080 RepID=UPI0015656793